MRSIVRLALAVAVAPLALLACGGEKPADTATTPAAAPSATPAATVASAATNVDSIGQSVYATCTTCHQANGMGVPGAFPPLAGSEIVTGKPEIPVAIVLHGMMGPVKVNGTEYNGMMTPWGGAFNDVQVAAVTTYIRSQWGNSAPAVTAELVAKVRAATSSRTTMWTWDELQKATF
jgi:mono/diheme cytochrome c family protein